MDTSKYKKLLEAEEKRLLQGMDHADANERDLSGTGVEDWTDTAVRDEETSAQFRTLSTDSTNLNLVRDALKRIEDGTYGKCAVDGGPIEEARLNAIPWTPYCIKHEEQLEKKNPRPMPTL